MKTPAYLLALCITLAGCTKEQPKSLVSAGEDSILTTFYPTTYFSERIAGGLLAVSCPLPDGEDPIFWQPSREALSAYQSAGLVVLNGASFEKWVEKASLPDSRVVDSAAGLPGELIRYEAATIHKHGPGGEHAHEGIDGHTWLDPQNATYQATRIHEAMAKRWPQHGAAFQSNLDALLADLESLDTRLRSLSPAPLFASHPAYNYLARRYRWDIDNLDLDPEAMPDGAQLSDLRERLAKRPVKFLLWESMPAPEIATKILEEFGLQSIVFSPCESRPEDGEDYISAMRANLDRLAEAQ